MRRYYILLMTAICFMVLHSSAQGQNKFPTDYFRHPMNLPVSMAGTFAEIRPNHFHSGIDLRTDAEEGKEVYATADGYVSRINISAWGGGKVLYITHPNGYRTVYMHLSAFCGDIGTFVHNYQYANHLYSFDIELPPDSIPVRKGQLVALSGNTGGSFGPHLHYEIRYAHNDQAINPLYFGIKYCDAIAPIIEGVKLYPANGRSAINGKNKEITLRPGHQGVTTVAGKFYTGIYTYDRMESPSLSKNGVEKIELWVDDTLFYIYRTPSFMFEETRAINAIIDYPHYQRTREYYIISRRLHGDPNNFSNPLKDYGYICFADSGLHTLEYRVSDHKGNTASCRVQVKSVPSGLLDDSAGPALGIEAKGEPIAYYKPFRFSRPGFRAALDAYTIYDNDEIVYSCSSDKRSLSPVHRFNLKRHKLPPHNSFTVKIPVPSTVPMPLVERLVVVCQHDNGRAALPTKEENGILVATSRSFGSFSVSLDTVPPTVSPENFRNGKKFRGDVLTVKIADNLTGVVAYECLINGEWVLAEHDGKTATLTVAAESLHEGKNTVAFRLTDGVGNSVRQTWQIVR